jgi:tRNA-2-methylthio-N6-dimethylallyladenosine synthase
MTTDKKRYFIETFGCKMNVNDSEKVAGLLQAEGYGTASRAADADFVFVNTCAVREKATDKLFHALGRLKHLKVANPDLVVGVGGCVAQLNGTSILERSPQVDVLVGTHNVARVPELVRLARETGQRGVDLDRKADTFTIPSASIAHSSPVRAYVTAMEGCNHVCSFCVVPRTRGPEVNRPVAQIVEEVEGLVARGYPEVMLLGQTVNAYQHDGVDFAGLLERVHDVPGLQRLRFTTSHPEHVSPRMADAFRDLPRLCPYLHLPVQSGSDRILESMRRGYDRATYLEKIALLRDRRPDLALTSDVIVGYPGETEADFEATVDLVETAGLEGLFVFTYSPRPGTTALRLADDVAEDEKLRRLQVLNERQQRAQAVRNATRVGRVESILVDTVDAEAGRIAGRTPHFRIVHTDGPATLLGATLDVRITGSGPNSLTGTALGRAASLTPPSPVPIF